MTPISCRIPSDLNAVSVALEIGNWPVVTPQVMQLLVTSRAAALIAPVHLAVAAAMGWQARADVERADEELDDAARGLPRSYQNVKKGRCYAVLPPRPGVEDTTGTLAWRTGRVVLREQVGLAEHRAGLRRGRLTSREVLVVAYIEHLRWVACDNFLLAAGADVRGVAFAPGSAALAQRATNLSRLADPAAGEIGTAIWRGMRGEWGVRSAALAELGTWQLVPTRGPGALPPDVPVRRARREAHRRARAYYEDLSA